MGNITDTLRISLQFVQLILCAYRASPVFGRFEITMNVHGNEYGMAGITDAMAISV